MKRVHQAGRERLQRSWPAEPASVAAARAAVSEFALSDGREDVDLAAVRLAVSEAVTNAVLHAYLDAVIPGPVHVSAEHRPDGLHVVVADEGRGMLPRTDSPGSGFGLSLITQATQSVQIERAATGGTTVHMHFADGSSRPWRGHPDADQ